jgi:hypothetical protein
MTIRTPARLTGLHELRVIFESIDSASANRVCAVLTKVFNDLRSPVNVRATQLEFSGNGLDPRAIRFGMPRSLCLHRLL